MKPTPLRRLSPSRRLMREYQHGQWLTDFLREAPYRVAGWGGVLLLGVMLGHSCTGN